MTNRESLNILLVGILIFLIVFNCQQKKEAPRAVERLEIYDEAADAGQDIQTAIGRASQEGKHILLMFGGNWCIWCHRLHNLMETDESIRHFLQEHYVLVMVDVGKRDKNLDLNEKYGNPYQHGFPVLVVLDEKGAQLTTQETGSLEKPSQEEDKGHDPEKVMAFLEKWAPEE